MNSSNFQTKAAIPPDLERIRAAGLDLLADAWCLWRYSARSGGGKPAKTPCGLDGRQLKVNDPAQWPAFSAVAEALPGSGFDGVGLLMSSTKGLVGLDLDNCLEGGEVVPEKAGLVADFLELGGYVETSPSGTGLRQFLKGFRLEDYSSRGRRGSGLEVYDISDGRYLTLTGSPYPAGSEARPVKSNQQALEAFICKYCDVQTTVGGMGGSGDGAGPGPETARGVADVLALLKRHNRRGKVTRLLNGNLDDHDGDHSAADLALCCEIAYFSRDEAVIDGVFRGSGLMRPKWDEARGKLTYGQRTISTSLEKQARNFDDAQRKKQDEAERAAGVGSHLIGGADDLKARRGWRADAWSLVELLARDDRLQGSVFFDDFAGWPIVARNLREVLDDPSAPSTVGRVGDPHIGAVCRWFGKQWGLRVMIKDAAQALDGWARRTCRNPVRERLEALGAAWDGVPRLDGWLRTYCNAKTRGDDGANITPYVDAAGSRWVISAVARAMAPGSKADVMLVLEGRQGVKKSSAARVLAEAVGSDYFREGFSLDAGKDDLIALRGRLIVEWGELSGLGRRDREHLKNFLSTQTDSYRSVFGVTENDWPRTAVFVGTTNERHYLSDSTGNRRFWPVSVGRILIDDLRRDAPLLWGEAVRRYQEGGRWWFDDDDAGDVALLRMAESEQGCRVGGTLWSEAAQTVADQMLAGGLECEIGGVADAIGVFSVGQVRAWMTRVAGVVVDDGNWLRVTDGLKAAGWYSRKSHGRSVWGLTPERVEAGSLWAA